MHFRLNWNWNCSFLQGTLIRNAIWASLNININTEHCKNVMNNTSATADAVPPSYLRKVWFMCVWLCANCTQECWSDNWINSGVVNLHWLTVSPFLCCRVSKDRRHQGVWRSSCVKGESRLRIRWVSVSKSPIKQRQINISDHSCVTGSSNSSWIFEVVTELFTTFLN